MKTKQNKIGAYLAVTAGVGCAASVANAGVVFYGPGAQSTVTTPSTPTGIDIGLSQFGLGYVDLASSPDSFFSFGSVHFTSGADLSPGTSIDYGAYSSGGVGIAGAVLGSDQNYANISFDGDDGIFEAVGQFFFDGAGGGYLVAIATSASGESLSISDGKAQIDAVPEPSGLALLALGSAGLISRRRRKAA